MVQLSLLVLAPAAVAAQPLLIPQTPGLLVTHTSARSERKLQSVAPSGNISGFKVVQPDGSLGCTEEWCTLSGEYAHSEALFGIPPYGGSKNIVGVLHYLTPGADQNGCDAEGYQYSASPMSEPAIFLLDAEGCSFVEIVRIAEKKGAAAVAVKFNNCLCSNTGANYTSAFEKQCGQSKGYYCSPGLPFMADDGSGGDISIPSLIVSTWDADRLADCYLTAADPALNTSISGVVCNTGQPIVVSLKWDMPRPDGNVEWSIWTNSDTDASFKSKFASTAKALQLSTTFTPHYFVFEGGRWGCTTAGLRCASQCTHEGRYCNPDPDRDLEVGVSGADIVSENLRQLCVWQQVTAGLAEGAANAAWWAYAITFAKNCHGGNTIADPDTFNEACSKRVHEAVEGVSWELTQQCVKDSDREDGSNALLEAEITSRTDKGIYVLPSAVVNNVVQRGAITPATVLGFICSGFLEATEPELCRCVASHDLSDVEACTEALEGAKCSEKEVYCDGLKECAATYEKCDKLAKARAPSSPVLSVGGIVGVTFSAMALVAFGGVAYWRNERKKVRREVQDIMEQYLPLEEIPMGSGPEMTVKDDGEMLAEI